jgi:putative RNA ligase
MKISDIMGLEGLDEMVGKGYVRAQHHPTEPLLIYNYTAACQWDRAWNDVTRQCRGLIVNEMGDVVARPFPKFFNYEEHEADFAEVEGGAPGYLPHLRLAEPVVVTDKLDGSLGILYPEERDGGWAIATRGSFTSEQAFMGTLMLRGLPAWEPMKDCTYLFEIIYPENRIVVKYDRELLVLLDVLETDTGLRATDFAWARYPGLYVAELAHRTLAEALAEPPRENAEGMVIYFPSTNMRIKLKQADYVALHKIVTGMNERTIWELLGEGKTAADICAPLPEEFWPWVEETAESLWLRARETAIIAREAYATICSKLTSWQGTTGWSRKDFALEAQEPEYKDVKSYLFMLLDSKDTWPAIWKSVRPRNPRSMAAQSEDTA